MAQPISFIKTSCSGGEVGPELYSKVDLARYGSWLKTAKNVFVHPTGAISNTPGTYFMAEAKFDGKKIRLRKFIFSTLQAYEIEFGEYYARFFTVGSSGGQIQKYTTWVTGTAYAVGDFVKNSTTYYECITAHTAGATFAGDAAKWDSSSWATATAYVIGDYVTNGGLMYYCIAAHTSGATDDEPGVGATTATYWVVRTLLEIPTPYDEADLVYLKFTQSADVLFIASPDYQTRQLNRLSNTEWTLTLYDFLGGPFQLPNTDASVLLTCSATTGLAKTLTASAKTWATTTVYQVGDYCTETATVYQCLVKHTSGTFATDLAAGKWVEATLTVFRSTHVGSLWKLRHYIEGQKVTSTASETTSSITCGGTWRVISHGTWTGSFKIQKSTDNGVTWTILREFTGADDFNVNTYGTEDMSDNAEPFLMRLVVVESSGAITVDLSTDPFYQEGIVKVTAYSSATVVTVDVKRLVGAVTATPDWSEGSWSDYRGWPSVVEFHPQDRLIFANTYTEPMTFWTTKTGNYYDFSRSSPLVDSDGITVTLPSREVNGINNLVPLTSLLALTSASEWSVGDPGTVLTPTSTEQRVNGYEGSSYVDAVVVGNRAIFIQNMGSLIRDLGYDLSEYSFKGADLSILANHLFFGYSITALDYQKYPYRLVYGVRSDGKLLTMTYMREQEILAWTWSDTKQSGALAWATGTVYVAGNWVTYNGATYYCDTGHTATTWAANVAKWTATDIDASYEDVSVVPASGYDEVWFSVKRGTKRYIERQVNRLASTASEDQFFVHCGLTYDGTATDTITGLDHLEGKTVAILADGNVLTQQVVLSGSLTLPDEYSVVHIGIPYESDIETLKPEIPTKAGTMQDKKIKISGVMLKMVNSRGGWIGPDFDTLYILRDNFVTDYDTAVDLYTGTLNEVLGGGYNDDGHFCFRQKDPLPFTISAIVPSLTIGGY
jgi:hypothetical protein